MRRLAGLVSALGLALLVAGGWLWFDNPTIDEGRDGNPTYDCLAPYDTVLNDASNFPGGEPPVNGESIDRKCRAAGRERFRVSVTLLVAGGATLAVSLVLVAGAAISRRAGGRGRSRPSRP